MRTTRPAIYVALKLTGMLGIDLDCSSECSRKLIFSSNGNGTLSVIEEKNANTFVTVAGVATMPGARTMAVDPESGRLYLVAADTTINPSADPSDLRHRYVVTPGSASLLFLDPTPSNDRIP